MVKRITRDRGKAPNLRVGTRNERCLSCVHYGYVPGRSWKGDGMCYLYDVPVREDFLCDSFTSEEEERQPKAKPLRKDNSKEKRAFVVGDLNPWMNLAQSPYHAIDVRPSNEIGTNASVADILADIEAEEGVT